MTPMIAVTARNTQIKSLDSYYSNDSYIQALHRAGCQSLLVLPHQSSSYYRWMAHYLDGLLITGGKDISPVLYSEEQHPLTTPESPQVDTMDFQLIHAFAEKGKPILGICRGAQIINVCFGGTLYQHLPEQPEFYCQHKATDYRSQGVHNITWQLKTPGLFSKDQVLHVNSLHHQGFNKIAPGFQIAGICEDGLVEAIIKNNILAVQWHPEEMPDDSMQQSIFTYAFTSN